MEELILEVKNDIIEALNLEDMTPEDLENDAPLFGADGLGLDSIDALELIMVLEKKYGIKLKDPKEGKDVFEIIDDFVCNFNDWITSRRIT